MAEKSDNAYRAIGEVAQITNLQQHVLRFWESKFAQIQPVKSARGRRLYRPEDIQLIEGIKDLLYNRGYSIRGAQQFIAENGVDALRRQGQSPRSNISREDASLAQKLEGILQHVRRARQELKDSQINA